MKSLRNYLLLILILFICPFTQKAFAAGSCNVLASIYSLNAGNYTVQRDAPVGTVIGSISGPMASLYSNCSFSGGSWIVSGIKSSLAYNSMNGSGYNIYNTNIPGVGIIIASTGSMTRNVSGSNCNLGWFGYISRINASGSRWYSPDWVGISGCTGNTGVNFSQAVNLQLVKTGPIPTGTSSLSGQLGAYTASVDTSYWMQEIPIVFSGGTVTQVACSITTPSVNVPLDPVLQSSFTGVNSTKGDKPFTIGLSCDAGARINASLSFDQNTDTSNISVINLTGAGSAGVATGVGIQLLYGSTPLQRNTNIVLKTSTGGQEFPAGAFTARYFQTKSTVTAGDANATATLNLTYQ